MSTPALLILLQWTVANGGALLATWYVWRRVRTGRPDIDLGAFLLLHACATCLTVLAFGLCGCLRPAPMATTLLVVGAFVAWRERSVLTRLPAEAGHAWREWVGGLSPGEKKVTVLLAAVFLTQLLRMAVHVWLLPPYAWDVLSYHLPNVAEWIRHGRVTTFETPCLNSFWPANFALMQTWFVVFFHHDAIVECAGLPFYLLGTVSVYSIGRSLKLAGLHARAAAVLFACTPAFALHATSCHNDIAAAALCLFLFALAMAHPDGRGVRLPYLLLVLVALALGAGTKATVVFALPGVVFVGVVACRGRPDWPAVRAELRARSAFAGALAAAGLLLGLTWYVRNAVLFGNPFYPVDVRLFGRLICGNGEGAGQLGTFSLRVLAENVQALVGQKIVDPEPYYADLPGCAGWGWFAVCCGLPAAAVACRRSRPLRLLLGGFILSGLTVLSMVSADPWNMRFLLWFPAVLALCFVVAMPGQGEAAVRTGLTVLAAVCTALNVAGVLGGGCLGVEEWLSLARTPVLERGSAMVTHVHGENQRGIAEGVPASAAIGFVGGNFSAPYPLYGPGLQRRVDYLRAGEQMQLEASLRRRGLRYLYVASIGFSPVLGEVNKQVESGPFRRLRGGLYRYDG